MENLLLSLALGLAFVTKALDPTKKNMGFIIKLWFVSFAGLIFYFIVERAWSLGSNLSKLTSQFCCLLWCNLGGNSLTSLIFSSLYLWSVFKNNNLIRLMGVLNEVTYVKHLAQFLAHGRCSLNINAPSQETTNTILNMFLYPGHLSEQMALCLETPPFL